MTTRNGNEKIGRSPLVGKTAVGSMAMLVHLVYDGIIAGLLCMRVVACTGL
jgi:hypothetical protein